MVVISSEEVGGLSGDRGGDVPGGFSAFFRVLRAKLGDFEGCLGFKVLLDLVTCTCSASSCSGGSGGFWGFTGVQQTT